MLSQGTGLRTSFGLVSDAVSAERSDSRLGRIVERGLRSRGEGDALQLHSHLNLCGTTSSPATTLVTPVPVFYGPRLKMLGLMPYVIFLPVIV